MKILPFILGLTLLAPVLPAEASGCPGGGNWCSPTVERSLTRETLDEIHQACVNEVYGNPQRYGGTGHPEDYSLIPVVKECEEFIQQRHLQRMWNNR